MYDRRSATDQEMNDIIQQMEHMENTGAFDQMFKSIITPVKGTNQVEFLKSIKPGMKLFKSFFLKIYGYDLNYTGFAENALSRLEILGCSLARKYYTSVVVEWQHEHDKEMGGAAQWYGKQNFDRKEVRGSRKIQNLTKNELMQLCQKLLKEGVIKTPEQFVTMVLQDL